MSYLELAENQQQLSWTTTNEGRRGINWIGKGVKSLQLRNLSFICSRNSQTTERF